MLKPFEYKGFTIQQSKYGGAAVKGTKKTATVQVMRDYGGNRQMLHQVSFKIDCPPCVDTAVEKAKKWVDKMDEIQQEFIRCRDDKEYFIEKYVKQVPIAVREAGQGDMGTVLKRIYDRLPYWMKYPFGPLQQP